MRVSELIEILPGNTPVTVQTIHVREADGEAVRTIFDGPATTAYRLNKDTNWWKDEQLVVNERRGIFDRMNVLEATVRGLPAGNGIMTIVAMEDETDDHERDQAER